jgi:DNA polymerase-1
MIYFDFETEAIAPYPDYPPKPVGVSIQVDDFPAFYLAWGHPTENNCSRDMASFYLKWMWESEHELCCQNARFDMAVLIRWFPEVTTDWGPWERIHDTMYLLFLNDPLSPLGLKPSADRLLDLPPEEQTAVRDWLVAHGVIKSNMLKWGGFIAKAPGDLVGTYAGGDTLRTKLLFELLMPKIVQEKMLEAYDRERQLAPLLSISERDGLRIDLPRLKADLDTYTEVFQRVTREAIEYLGKEVLSDFNIDSGVQLAFAAKDAGMTISDDEWPKTPTGKLSTKREVLDQVITDRHLFSLLAYRGALKTLLGTFMGPWYEKGLLTGGILHPHWNQVKSDQYGALTGRLSSSDPNFQNIPTEYAITPPPGYPELPHMRVYVLADAAATDDPEDEEVFVSADFHSQEIRMLGHYAGGGIKYIYDNDPSADVHQVAAVIISENTGHVLTRKHTKIVAFSILYGAGIGTMAGRMGVPRNEAAKIRSSYMRTLTGVQEFMTLVEFTASQEMPVRSWGGRLLRAPPPAVQRDGRIWNKDYVLLNYLIQGSSADQTKQAIIEYHKTRKHGRFLATVHDEICISVSKRHLDSEVAILKAAMEGGVFNIPMRATVKVGPNWFDMKDHYAATN